MPPLNQRRKAADRFLLAGLGEPSSQPGPRMVKLTILTLTQPTYWDEFAMAKPQRKLKKANHGKRPANAKSRRAKRWAVKT